MHGLGEDQARKDKDLNWINTPLWWVVLLLCMGGAAASERGESDSQQRRRSLLSHWFTLCTMMFMFKFTCVVMWQMSTILFFSLAMIVRAVCKCVGCMCFCVRTICCKPVLILCGSCMFCFAYSLHVTGCLDPYALGCGLFHLLVNCYFFIELTMKTFLCTNHPMIYGALGIASAGHLASALVNFLGKPGKYRRLIISCRKVKARRYGQNRCTVGRLKCKQQKCDIVESLNLSDPAFQSHLKHTVTYGGDRAVVLQPLLRNEASATCFKVSKPYWKNLLTQIKNLRNLLPTRACLVH